MADKEIIKKVLGIKPLSPEPPTEIEHLAGIHEQVEVLVKAVEDSDIPDKSDFAVLIASIRDIKPSPEIDLSGVEKLLEKIEKKEIDISELKTISEILADVLTAVKELSVAPKKEEEKLDYTNNLETIQNILNTLNMSVAGIELPNFDYKKFAQIIKDNLVVNVQSGGGGATDFVRNKSNQVINPATSEKQDSIISAIQAIPAGSQIYGTISTNNATSTPLGIGATFTGTGEDVKDYVGIGTAIVVDRSGTLNVEFSTDNINWNHTQVYPITVTTPGVVEGFFYQFMCEARYFRFRYVNGVTAQGTFRLQPILKTRSGTSEVHAVNVPLLSNTDALVTKGVIYGVTTAGGGAYVAVKVGPSGAIQVGGTLDTITTLPLPAGASTEATLRKVLGMDIPVHDYKSFGYTGTNLTSIVYKTGGSGGTTVATKTIGYDAGGNIVSMTLT